MCSKALGTATLIAALEPFEVGTFVNLSSTSGRFGNRGQFSYAAGHELASRLVAMQRDRRPGRWLNFHYGSWWDEGMVRRGDVMQRLRNTGSSFLTRETGTRFFCQELKGNFSQDVVFSGDEILHGGQNVEKESETATPLLDWVRTVTTDTAEGGRKFDPSDESIVADHIIEFEEPILPGFVSLEMMAQTAAVLLERGLSLKEIREARFLRAIRFPRSKPRDVNCRVQLIQSDSEENVLEGEVFEVLKRPGTGQRREASAVRATLVFGRHAASPKPALLLPSSGTADYRVSAKPLWETTALGYRKGVFRNIFSIGSVSWEGTEGEVLSPALKIFGPSPLLKNPLRLDGMTALLEPILNLLYGRSHRFLGSFETLELFGDGDPSDIRFVRCLLRGISDKDAVFDVEAVDSLGQVAERFRGLKKVFSREISREELREPIWRSLEENPRQRAIREQLAHPEPLAIASTDVKRIESAYREDPRQVLTQLAGQEQSFFETLQNPKRKLEFLAGRIAGKAAVRLLENTKTLNANQIRIIREDNGQPRVQLETCLSGPRLSIAHSKDVAVAVASRGDKIGVDVEEIQGSIRDIRDQFSDEQELEIVSRCIRASIYKRLTHLWVIKEAVRKVAGANRLPMTQVRVVEAENQGDYLISKILTSDRSAYKAVSYFSGKHVFAFSRRLEE
jgi:holo-[acyl-carrier protein] synthase